MELVKNKIFNIRIVKIFQTLKSRSVAFSYSDIYIDWFISVTSSLQTYSKSETLKFPEIFQIQRRGWDSLTAQGRHWCGVLPICTDSCTLHAPDPWRDITRWRSNCKEQTPTIPTPHHSALVIFIASCSCMVYHTAVHFSPRASRYSSLQIRFIKSGLSFLNVYRLQNIYLIEFYDIFLYMFQFVVYLKR